MKKSYSVNISGIIFQVDEDAYDKLSRYLDRLNLHFANTDGKEEIIADIEQRIAEMIVSRQGEGNRVVTLALIEEIIRTLGEPADFDDQVQEPVSSERRYRKRLYRDPDDKVLGGVAGGMGAYFNTDPLWFRIIFIALTIFGGSGIIIYLVLWLIVPEARTTADRLEMRGEEININNIERTIKEEMNDLRNRFGTWKKGGYTKKKEGPARLIETLAQVFVTVVTLFAKFLAGIIGLAFMITVIALIFAIFVPGISLHGFPILYNASLHDLLTSLTGNPGMAWMVLTALILLIVLPLLGLFYAGIRLLFGYKGKSRIAGATFSGLWMMAVLFLTVITIITINDFSTKGSLTGTQSIAPAKQDTLLVTMLPGLEGQWLEEENVTGKFRSVQVQYTADGMKLVGQPKIEFKQSHNDSILIVTTYRARGASHSVAAQRAADITYRLSADSASITLDQFFGCDPDMRFRDQEVKVTLYLPENTPFRLDPHLQNNHKQITNFEPLWDKTLPSRILTMQGNKVVMM
jgi:phage shock protein PspC (stress-responsive transcriptional regulator)